MSMLIEFALNLFCELFVVCLLLVGLRENVCTKFALKFELVVTCIKVSSAD